jgi:dienelactone hydrolase
MELPIILHFDDQRSTLVSPEQSPKPVPVAVTRSGNAVTVDIAMIGSKFVGTLSGDGKVLDGTFSQSGMALPAHFAHRAPGAAAPVAARPQTPKPPFPYASTDVSFTSADGTALAGTLTRPAGVANAPAVVLIAGSGPNTRDEPISGHKPFLLLADRLTRAGIAVLRYDKRGVGGSGGRYSEATETEFIADAAAAAAWLRTQPGIDPAHVGLIGHSEGAEIAPEVAHDPKIAFVAMLAPPGMKGGDVILSQRRAIELAMGVPPAQVEQGQATEKLMIEAALSSDDPAVIRARIIDLLKSKGMPDGQAQAIAGETASTAFRVFLAHDPIPAIRALKVPTLVVLGSKDLQVVPADNLPAIRTALAGHKDTKIIELPGLNHLLQPAIKGTPAEYQKMETTIDEGALTLIVDWVKAVAR